MTEISEVERARRRLHRAQQKKEKPGTTSFRLGTEHLAKLAKMAESSGLSQAEVVRTLLDKEWVRIKNAKAARKAAQAS